MIPNTQVPKESHFPEGFVTQLTREKVMPARMLVKDGRKYSGKYVATKSFKDKKILCAGTNPVKVVQEAKRLGAKDPVLIFVPKEGIVHIY